MTIELTPLQERLLRDVLRQGRFGSVDEALDEALRSLAASPPTSLLPLLTPSERAAAWREAARSLPHTPPLSDEAISRETIYEPRG
jgi:Arc/MetJ-type ribon-helix-helix transcriptional regulator